MLRCLATAARKWLRFAEILGNIQFTIFLSLLYRRILLNWAIPYKVFTDLPANGGTPLFRSEEFHQRNAGQSALLAGGGE